MYTKSAHFYDALYSFKDYAEASRQLCSIIKQHHPPAATLLDVGCGTGRHLECLRDTYCVEGLDINPKMLEVARRRCPEVPLHEGNMIDFRLNRAFDVVTCLFSSIGYVKTKENLDRTVATLAYHLNPGGLVIVEPWFTPETYWIGRVTANFVDEPELKIAWMYASEPHQNQVATLDIKYLVGTPGGIERFDEHHELGLFTHEEYMSAFVQADLHPSHDQEGLFGRGLYLGKGKL